MSGRVLEGRNRATADEAASFVDKFDELEKKIDALKIEHMNKVRAVRQEQSEVLDDAKSQGVPKKVVKAIAESRKLEAKAKAKIDDLLRDRYPKGAGRLRRPAAGRGRCRESGSAGSDHRGNCRRGVKVLAGRRAGGVQAQALNTEATGGCR